MPEKKSWMKIQSGLLKAEHRERMKGRVWLYMYVIDNADWDTGIMFGFTDEKAAIALGSTQDTIRKWRIGLQGDEYITCKPSFQSQKIVIHKWRNPRLINPPQINIKGECPKMDTHPLVKMDTHPLANLDTPSLDHNPELSEEDHPLLPPLIKESYTSSVEPILTMGRIDEINHLLGNGTDQDDLLDAFRITMVNGKYGQRNIWPYVMTILRNKQAERAINQNKEATRPDDPIRKELEEQLYG